MMLIHSSVIKQKVVKVKVAKKPKATIIKARAWIGVASTLVLLVLIVGVFMFLNAPRSISKENPDASNTQNLITTTSPTTEVLNSQPVELVVPRLEPVNYPPQSVVDACEVNDFPPMDWYLQQDWDTTFGLEKKPWKALKNGKCSTALEQHVSTINPYLWGKENATYGSQSAFAFVNIDNPLTFERIFTDPLGDLGRVQEALARPECQLGQDAPPNWKLNEICHADAILNFALVTRFCYNEYPNRSINDGNGVSNRTRQYYHEEDNPTPEQDLSMWIQSLEGDWVREKCKTLNHNINLHSPVHTELRKQITALQVADHEKQSWQGSLNAALINLAARLGDAAAGLTYPFSVIRSSIDHVDYREEGYKYGPLTGWFTTDWEDPTHLFTKHPPSVDRLRRLMALFAENPTKDGQTIDFNHEALVQYLCAPPYYYLTLRGRVLPPPPKPPSCRTIVAELRQELHDNQTFLGYIATFEDVAMRLDVYE